LKRLFSIALSIFAIATFALATFAFGAPALAQDDMGKKVFDANCGACHFGGGNTINPSKTLKKEVLEKYGKFSAEAIYEQDVNGAGAMPSFKRLGEEKLRAVAAYIMEQAEAGWK